MVTAALQDASPEKSCQIKSAIREALNADNQTPVSPEQQDIRLFTIAQASKALNVSRSTMNRIIAKPGAVEMVTLPNGSKRMTCRSIKKLVNGDGVQNIKIENKEAM